MFTIFAHTEAMKDMVSFAQIKPVLAGLVLIILALLGIVIYMVRTWQPKSFTEAPKLKTTVKKKPGEKK